MKIFQDPYIKIENTTPVPSLIGYKGNTIYSIEIINKVPVLSSEAEKYEEFHNYLNQIVSTIGEGYTIQKTDIFYKQQYHNSKEDLEDQTYLQQEYSKHFEGRISQKIRTILTITNKTTKVVKYSKKVEDALFDNVQKAFRILKMAGLEPRFLKEGEYDQLYFSILTQNFSGQKILNNFEADATHIDFGHKVGVSLPFFDTEKLELPNEIAPYVTLGKESEYAAAVDNFSFLTEIPIYDTMIYNQYIEIPNQTEIRNELAKKQNRHQGLSTETYNLDCSMEIDDFIASLEKNNELIVKSHINLFVTTKNKEDLEELTSLISTYMFQKNIVLSKSSYNQYELFRSIFPGVGATELKEYDLFTTTTNTAVAFFFKERFLVDDKSSFYLRFADRQGVPVNVDPSDIPMEKGIITNRNKIILGPSGTGKSFLMNNFFEQYLNFNYDIVVIDVGDSYASLCKFFGGKYITYKEEAPISMNPFKMDEAELNEEKLQTLVELCWIIWQGVDSLPSKTQSNVLNTLLTEYYKVYFEKFDTQTKTTDELIVYLEKYNISRADLIQELKDSYKVYSKNLYKVLQIEKGASTEEVKKAWRQQIMLHHPDVTGISYNAEKVHDINVAYHTLSDAEKRAEYDQSLVLTDFSNTSNTHTIFENGFDTNQTRQGDLRELAIQKLDDIVSELDIKELNFNSLFEFAKAFLPLHLKAKDIAVNDFDASTFLYNMSPFYKGGRYDTVLNESIDSSLFDERFIVFEIDNIKDNPQLFPIVTTVIMDTFIQKMRHRKNVRKALYIEEAWKAIASPAMAGSIKYLYKTVRKFYGEVGIVTQDLADIAKSEVVKDAILGSTDIVLLLDQRKMKKNYGEVRKLLNISEAEAGQIFTINNLDNKEGRGKFKEFWMRIGTQSAVYGLEVSNAQYLTYTTEKPEKTAVEYYLNLFPEDQYTEANKLFISDQTLTRLTRRFFRLINDLGMPLNDAMRGYISDFLHSKNPDQLLEKETLKHLKSL